MTISSNKADTVVVFGRKESQVTWDVLLFLIINSRSQSSSRKRPAGLIGSGGWRLWYWALAQSFLLMWLVQSLQLPEAGPGPFQPTSQGRPVWFSPMATKWPQSAPDSSLMFHDWLDHRNVLVTRSKRASQDPRLLHRAPLLSVPLPPPPSFRGLWGIREPQGGMSPDLWGLAGKRTASMYWVPT